MKLIGALEKEGEMIKRFPSLQQKIIVDYANGIDVNRDLIITSKANSSFGKRVFEGLTGASRKRQDMINENTHAAVSGALQWLQSLSQDLALTNTAVIKLKSRVDEIAQDISEMAGFIGDLHDRVTLLKNQTDQRFNQIEHTLREHGANLDATSAMQLIFGKARSGGYGALDLPSLCYAVVEELKWSDFGAYILQSGKHSDRMVETAKHELIALVKQNGRAEHLRMSHEEWLAQSAAPTDVKALESIQYLGDWSSAKINPFSFGISQRPQKTPLQMPTIYSGERLVTALLEENGMHVGAV